MSNQLKIFVTASLIAGVAAASLPASVLACSRILSNNNGHATIVARTMDLNRPDRARMVVYPRGMDRVSDTGEGKPLQWTSKYGSVAVTANLTSTTDGMNERGLVADILYLGNTSYEPCDERPGLSNLSWGQYVLDNFSSVAEAVEAMKAVRIVPVAFDGVQWPLHLSISDADGDSAIIEFVDGKIVIHHGKDYTVMTNEPPLETQLETIRNYKLFGGSKPLPGDIDPASRFVRAATYLKTLPPAESVLQALADAQSVARNVAVPRGAKDTSGSNAEDAWPTLWFTLADSTHGTYYFHSATSPSLYWVELTAIDFAPNSGERGIDAYALSLNGDITSKFARPR
ncbi:linear amide C-N hydrolase [Rhizobium sp. SSA_523]|uniref:linear amide C-N hydrolase n=1 Tax=Rhizobium sp. SSA_523 TaxID=2952477 RepID=UPI0020900F83|nr:linear amide C-N hydrolase [Rhizobium sp. SSA_523]MCO5734743.1 linear amide C-N hydrolase [Rhizobium sp. SSA_523]WKC22982.1 linear amide C-N hydrolase [Rhizobium sp. SSA_523]